MRNLLKADFFRLIKNKLLYVAIGLAIGLPFLISGLSIALIELLNYLMSMTEGGAMTIPLNGLSFISTTFSYGDNLGLIIPIFASIVIMGDVNSGTLRNKITIGHKRHNIYLSHFIVTLTFLMSIMILYALVNSFCSFVIVGGVNFQKIIESLIYFYITGLISFVFIASIITFFALKSLKSASAIIFPVLVCFGFGILASFIGPMDFDWVNHIFNFIPGFTPAAFAGRGIDLIMLFESTVGVLAFSALFYFLGYLSFKKKDIA